jgi:hypothetical protein
MSSLRCSRNFTPLRSFARRWAAHRVSERRRRIERVAHPERGELRLAHEVFVLPDDGEQRLVTWLPADDATVVALRRALDSPAPVGPAQLRVVGAP